METCGLVPNTITCYVCTGDWVRMHYTTSVMDYFLSLCILNIIRSLSLLLVFCVHRSACEMWEKWSISYATIQMRFNIVCIVFLTRVSCQNRHHQPCIRSVQAKYGDHKIEADKWKYNVLWYLHIDLALQRKSSAATSNSLPKEATAFLFWALFHSLRKVPSPGTRRHLARWTITQLLSFRQGHLILNMCGSGMSSSISP